MVNIDKPRLVQKQFVGHVCNFFRNMPFKFFAILVLFTICLSSTTYFAFFSKNDLHPPTEINGFLTFATVYNNQGKINLTKNEILIEATPASQPRVLVYASTDTFKWSFSATPLSATGYSHPIAFSVDWKFGEFLVWADATYGWYCNYRFNNTWVSTGIYLNSTLTLGSRYDIEIEWTKLSETVTTNLLISNSSWQKELMLEISVPPNAHIEYSNLYVAAWANNNARSTAIFDSSQFVSYNSAKFTQQTPFSLWALLASSIAMSIITIFVLVEKFWQVPFTIRLLFRRIGALISSMNAKKSMNNMISYVKRYNVVLLLFIFFGGLRLVLAAISYGHLFDTYTTKTWLSIIESKGTVAIFPFSDILPQYMGIRPVYPYPPIIAYTLSLIPGIPAQENLASVLMKSPAMAADLLIGALVFFTFKNREGLTTAVPALFLSLLNFVDSSIWGQYDSIVALFMVLSVWFVATKRMELGWIFAALAISTKQTALVLIPGLLILSIKQKQWSRLFYGFMMFAAVLFLVWYPFLQNGFSFDFATGVSGLRLWSPGGGLDPVSPEGGGGTSIWAFNIWPLVTLALNGQPPSVGIIGGVKDTLPNQFYTLSYFQLGTIIFALVYIALSIRVWKAKNPRDVMLQFGLLMLAFYMLPTRVHERYLIFALSFLPSAYTKSKILVGSYLVLLVTYWLSLEYALLGGPWRIWTGGFSPLINAVFSDYGLFVLISINVLVFLLLFFKTSSIPLHKRINQSEREEAE